MNTYITQPVTIQATQYDGGMYSYDGASVTFDLRSGATQDQDILYITCPALTTFVRVGDYIVHTAGGASPELYGVPCDLFEANCTLVEEGASEDERNSV